MIPQVFQHAEREIRVVMVGDSPWWVAKDVCDVLGVAKVSNSVSLLDDDERGTHTVGTPSGNQDMLVINEAGLYSLILRSRKPEAKAFKRWVTHEVLPTLRKTGKFEVKAALPTDYKTALLALVQEVEAKEKLEAKVLEMTPKAVFHDQVSDASNCHTMEQAAKLLGTGRNRFYEWCYQNSIIMRFKRTPYQEYLDRGYFRLVETPYLHPHTREPMLTTKPVVTGKGLIWLAEKYGAKLSA